MTTITSKFTKERLIDWAVVAVAERVRDLKDAPESVEAAANLKLAEITLASLTAEPVAWKYRLVDINSGTGDHWKYSTQCITPTSGKTHCIESAPLYTISQPVPERERIRREHAEWSDKTFGDVGPIGPLKHLSKEALETAAAPDDLSEWADMQFLLWDAQRRAGISDGEITLAMKEKLAVNKKREWPEPKDGEPRLHIKEQPAQVVPEEMPKGLAGQIVSLLAHNIGDKFLAQKIWNTCRAAMLQGKFLDLSQPVDPQVAKYEQIMLQAGWVMVPIEPTDEMIAAAMECDDVVFDSKDPTAFCVQYREIYCAMVDVAPKPEGNNR
ncbi:DUF550 domain-containing protein [Salmonella enterica subsp. diarizonae]|nr:DUF550 domain-containing protein [Salmonella enterica subsp. diarizonae]ECI3360030.1 DUF550 domain-containing protein [Salmonella enterica subsp. diarizonae]